MENITLIYILALLCSCWISTESAATLLRRPNQVLGLRLLARNSKQGGGGGRQRAGAAQAAAAACEVVRRRLRRRRRAIQAGSRQRRAGRLDPRLRVA